MSIVFYDSPSSVSGKPLSPNMWKTRFCLNYKGISYKTEWVEYRYIGATCKKLGIPPTGKYPHDGSDFYSFPAIYDPSTGLYISDSLKIAEYLDKTYPDVGPKIFPDGTLGLQTSVYGQIETLMMSFFPVFALDTWKFQEPTSKDYYRNKIETMLGGVKLEYLAPTGEKEVEAFNALKAGLDKFDEYYGKTDDKGPFLMGPAPSWCDFVIGAFLQLWKNMWGEDDQKWKDISSWHNGRWGNLEKSLQKYGAIL